MTKPKYLILSNDNELARYVAWNEGIIGAEAHSKVMEWPELRQHGRAYRVVPESELRCHMRKKRDYENFAARIREASSFMQGRASGHLGSSSSWSSYAFVVKA